MHEIELAKVEIIYLDVLSKTVHNYLCILGTYRLTSLCYPRCLDRYN